MKKLSFLPVILGVFLSVPGVRAMESQAEPAISGNATYPTLLLASSILEKAGLLGLFPEDSMPGANMVARCTGVAFNRGAGALAQELSNDGITHVVKRCLKKVTGWNELIASPAPDSAWVPWLFRSGAKIAIEEIAPYIFVQTCIVGPFFAGWDRSRQPSFSKIHADIITHA
jgi:hypothetical protein